MQAFFTVQWADLDPNFHVRHSVYYDWCATARIGIMAKLGFTQNFMMEHHIGPIIFREECVFKKEVHFTDTITIQLAITQARRNMSRWTIQHHIYKPDNELAAIVTVDGSFIDTHLRKIAQVPHQLIEAFNKLPKSKEFVWLD
jgi:acyl-CoA thioester hydrolase